MVRLAPIEFTSVDDKVYVKVVVALPTVRSPGFTRPTGRLTVPSSAPVGLSRWNSTFAYVTFPMNPSVVSVTVAESVIVAEVEVVDPRHPLYGRRYRLISIGKESTTRGACKESFARVHYRFGLTLLLPLGVTNLERNGLPRATPTKLSLDALQDLIALAEESGGTCPSNLERSGAVCRKRSGRRSQKISAKSCGR